MELASLLLNVGIGSGIGALFYIGFVTGRAFERNWPKGRA